MRNKYAGSCLRCRKLVPAGKGYFQRHRGRWLVRCHECLKKGNQPIRPGQVDTEGQTD